MTIIGIDPGLDGAVAILSDTGKLLALEDTPTLTIKKAKGKKRVYVPSAMLDLIAPRRTGKVIIENVHAMPKQGVTSMFSMGHGFGLWIGIATGLGLPITYIEPSAWKKAMGIPTGADKNTSIIRAAQVFPSASLSRKKDHGRADALLIAEYGRKL